MSSKRYVEYNEGLSCFFHRFFQKANETCIKAAINFRGDNLIENLEVIATFIFSDINSFSFFMINSELEISFFDFIFHLTRNNSVPSFLKFIPRIYFSPSFKVQVLNCKLILVKL